MPAVAGDLSKRADDDLIRECRQGREAAFLELYRRYKNRVFSFALTLLRNVSDAEDVTQDVFRYVFTKIHHYQPKGRFKSFIFKITHSISIDVLRKRSRQQPMEENFEIGYLPAGTGNPHVEQLRACYARLPRMYREIMALRVMDDLAYEEIAEVLGIPIGTVKSRIHHAVEMLRRMLTKVRQGADLGPPAGDEEVAEEEA